MSYCPVCGNTEPDYKCGCIEEATGIKPGAKPRKRRVVVETEPDDGPLVADGHSVGVCSETTGVLYFDLDKFVF